LPGTEICAPVLNFLVRKDEFQLRAVPYITLLLRSLVSQCQVGEGMQVYLTVKLQHNAKCDLSDCGTLWTCVLTRWEFVDQL